MTRAPQRELNHLITGAQRVVMKANAKRDADHVPVVKLVAGGAAAWLLTELDENGDKAFGLCDLGMGSPELGYVSLSELLHSQHRFGHAVERDAGFRPTKTLGEYAAEARAAGRIVA